MLLRESLEIRQNEKTEVILCFYFIRTPSEEITIDKWTSDVFRRWNTLFPVVSGDLSVHNKKIVLFTFYFEFYMRSMSSTSNMHRSDFNITVDYDSLYKRFVGIIVINVVVSAVAISAGHQN